MPKVPEISIVDIDIRKRIEAGMLTKRGMDIRGNEEEYTAFLRLCRLAGVEPLVSTYDEMDEAIKEMWQRWRERVRVLDQERILGDEERRRGQ